MSGAVIDIFSDHQKLGACLLVSFANYCDRRFHTEPCYWTDQNIWRFLKTNYTVGISFEDLTFRGRTPHTGPSKIEQKTATLQGSEVV